MLSDYQTAILNEMGITLLVKRDSLESLDTEDHQQPQTTSQSTVSKIQALRNAVTQEDPNPVQQTNIISNPESDIVKDIARYFEWINVAISPVEQWKISESATPGFSATDVSLPFDISILSAQQKRQLWQQIIASTKDK